MRPKARTCRRARPLWSGRARFPSGITAWVLLLFLGSGLRSFSQSLVQTDAAGGIFREDQNLSFSISGNGWFRLLLDGKEIYRGRGPAYPELGINKGEERGFSLSAEYYSAQDKLLESRSWYIYIDKKAPSIPDLEIRNKTGGLFLHKSGEKPNVRIRALAEMEGRLVFFPDLGGGEPLPPDSFSAIVWAEDLAGNYSDPRAEFVEISLAKIDNPVSGGWLNPQVLIISGAEGKDIYWTSDGTHPLTPGGTGRLYRGPERIEKRGPVILRIAWRNYVGRVFEDSVAYSVAEYDEGGFPENLNIFRLTEERPVSSEIILPLPENVLWSIDSFPRKQEAESISLRPQALTKRTTAIHLSPVSRGMGIYRFAYLLDGGRELKPSVFPSVRIEAAALPVDSQGKGQGAEAFLYPGPQREAGRYDLLPLRLVSEGKSRVIVWPRLPEIILYSWENNEPASWQEAYAPLLVPLEGGKLRWYMTDRAQGETGTIPAGGYYSVTLDNLTASRNEVQRGRIAFSNYNESGKFNWEYVSDMLDYSPGIVNKASMDVCDGEDLVWAFISTGGKILEEQRRDRLPPAAPQLDAPPERGWSRGPVTVSVLTGGKDLAGSINARIVYASGKVEVLDGTDSLVIDSAELAEVTVESFLMDNSGNRSSKTIRRFTLDPKTIYVSSEPLLSGTPGRQQIRGGMDNPFSSLEEALDFVLKQDSGDIRIAGRQELRRPVTISRNIHIDGGWIQGAAINEEISGRGASVILGSGFSWNIGSGAGLKLSGLSLERNNGDNSLIQASRNGTLEISGAVITNTGALLNMESGICRIKDSQIKIKAAGERRVAAFAVRGSEIEFNSSRVQLEGDYCLLYDGEEGSFNGRDSVFLSAGHRTASLFVLNRTRANFTNLTLHAVARDYTSVLEASASELVLNGGILEVSARDATALLLDNCATLIMNAQIRVEGTSSARAADIRGAFPIVKSTHFYSIGSAKKTEVFSGINAIPPLASSITGNLFSGFERIWGDAWPLEKLQSFNRAYASPAAENLRQPAS